MFCTVLSSCLSRELRPMRAFPPKVRRGLKVWLILPPRTREVRMPLFWPKFPPPPGPRRLPRAEVAMLSIMLAEASSEETSLKPALLVLLRLPRRVIWLSPVKRLSMALPS